MKAVVQLYPSINQMNKLGISLRWTFSFKFLTLFIQLIQKFMPRLALISNESPVYCLHLAQKLLSNIVQSFFFYYEKESFSLKLWKVFVLSSAKNGIKFIKRKFHISSENFPKSWSFHWKISFYRFFLVLFHFQTVIWLKES